jgi:hypothetical protein
MTSLRRPSRQRALALAGLVAVATPLMSSCGFDYATDRPNNIANGGYHIFGDVHVLAARIIAPSSGAGTFVATITVEPEADPVTFTGVSGKGLTAGQFQPVQVPSNGMVNLYSQGGVPVSGDFAAGDNIPVSVEFEGGQSIDVHAIVVKQCYEYSGVQSQSPSARPSRQASGSPSSSGSSSASPSGSASQSGSASSSASSSSPSAAATGAPYSCDYPSVPPVVEASGSGD